mgnify:CR=1 FL=1
MINMVKCPNCGEEVPTEGYIKHYDACSKRKEPLPELPKELDRLIKDEKKAYEEYTQLANRLLAYGRPIRESSDILLIANEEWKHHGMLLLIRESIFGKRYE